jgi:hypothetical protein
MLAGVAGVAPKGIFSPSLFSSFPFFFYYFLRVAREGK